jgi:hypothetical protein
MEIDMPTIETSGWHLDKRVPVSIIVVLLVYGISGMWFIADIKRDVEILKAAQIVQHERDDRQDKTVAEALADLREAVKDGNRKLDRLIELRFSKEK